jgi:hypothetical protein
MWVPPFGWLGALGLHLGVPPGAGTTGRAPAVAAHLLKHHLNRYTMPDGCLCPAQRRVHQQVYLHPYPEELMPRNHEWIQSSLVDRTSEGFVATLPTVC